MDDTLGYGPARFKTGKRQKSTLRKVKKEAERTLQERLRAYCEEKGVDPFTYMVDLLSDALPQEGVHPLIWARMKFDAAKELAAYLEPKLKSIDVKQTIKADITVDYAQRLREALREE